MSTRLGIALQRWMVASNGSPLRLLWRAAYALLARGAAAWLGRGTSATIYLTGSLAGGEPVYGLSDVDLVVVVPDSVLRPVVRRRLATMHARLPLLRRVIAHVWVYDEAELEAAASAPYPTFGLDSGRAALTGEDALADAMGLLDRPGLSRPAEGWRRLRGHGQAPVPPRDRQDERIAAWLEVQYRLRWALPALVAPEPLDHQLAGAVGGVARVWLSIVHDEPTAGNRSALGQAGWRMESLRDQLWLAGHVIGTGRCDPATARALWSTLVALVADVAGQIELELVALPATEVRLQGAIRDPELPLLDWCGLALPRVEWPPDGRPVCEPPRFVPLAGDAADAAAVAAAMTPAPWTAWNTLRHGPVLVRPTLAVWDRGRLRTAELPASDPVSFALLDGRTTARFPEVSGWSALDRARRAVAEHRGWLFGSPAGVDQRPEWAGGRPPAGWDAPATRSLLLSAARAALFLESIEEGRPLLALDQDATVGVWRGRDPFAGEAAQAALDGLRGAAQRGAPLHYEEHAALLDAVHRLPAYASPRAPGSPPPPRGTTDGPAAPSRNGHHGTVPVRLAPFPLVDRNPYMQLLYGAMSDHGLRAVGDSRLELGWLWRQRASVALLHFHWDKYYAESTALDARWPELRSWGKLIRFGALLAFARRLGYRIVWTVHEVVPHEPRSRRRDLLAAKALARASHALMAHDHATEQRTRDWLSLNGREIPVIPHGSYVGVYPEGRSREVVRREWDLDERQLVFLAFGNLRSYKRLELLLEAFAMVDEPDVALIVAGEFVWRFRQPEWEQRLSRQLREAAERDPRIRYRVGRVPDPGVAELHHACDVAVMARSDGWTSGSMLLALSLGLPVVAARQPAYVDLIGEEAAGWLYEPGSAADLARALSRAARERRLLPDKAREASRVAQQRNWEEIAAGTASVLLSTLQDRS